MLNQLTLVTCDMLKFLLWILHKNSNKNESSSVFIWLLIILRQLSCWWQDFQKFIVSLSYDNRKMFCELDVRRKSVVTFPLL